MSIIQDWQRAPMWQRLLIVVIIPASIIVAIWFYLILPIQEKISKLEQKKHEIMLQKSKYSRFLKGDIVNKLELRKSSLLNEIETKKNKIGVVYFHKNDLPKILTTINSIAMENNIVIKNISVSNIEVIEYGVEGNKIIELKREHESRERRKDKKDNQKKNENVIKMLAVMLSISIEGKQTDMIRMIRALLNNDSFLFLVKKIEYKSNYGGFTNGELEIKILLRHDNSTIN